MIIEGEFYRLTPVNEHSIMFDLELLYDIGGKNPRQEFKIAGYGYRLDSAIKTIIAYRINKKFKESTLTLKQYLDEFKKISEEIKQEISVCI
jgi:hypothetical protein